MTSLDLAWHMSTSLSRLLLWAVPVAAMLMAPELRGVFPVGKPGTV